jgi:hypothetical protein
MIAKNKIQETNGAVITGTIAALASKALNYYAADHLTRSREKSLLWDIIDLSGIQRVPRLISVVPHDPRFFVEGR